ncbi:hypothetical protein [Burkholderia sp. BCC1977]|nr:hypothetical protein [Burkholderia sp. BCC1977]
MSWSIRAAIRTRRMRTERDRLDIGYRTPLDSSEADNHASRSASVSRGGA